MSSESTSKLSARKCIVQAATKLFAKLGLDKCSTREIAKEANSNISLISYYFGGKEGLYKEVMRDHALEVKNSLGKILQHAERNPRTQESFIYQVGLIIENIIWFRTHHPEMAKIFAREKLTGMLHANEVHEEIFHPMIKKFYEIFEEGQKKGYVRADVNPALFFVTLSEGVWGFFEMSECKTHLSEECGHLDKNPNELKNQIMNIYLRGVLL